MLFSQELGPGKWTTRSPGRKTPKRRTGPELPGVPSRSTLESIAGNKEDTYICGNMYIAFTMPGLPRKPAVSGIYRLTFDEKWIYIGSATNFWVRFQRWKHDLSKGIFKNYRMAEVGLGCTAVKMEIVEIVEQPERLLERESYYIQQNWGNESLLNRSPTGGTNEGMKLEEWQVAEAIERSWKFGQPVGKFSKDGTFIEKYRSLGEAMRINGLDKRRISKVLRFSGTSARGFVYRKLDAAGNPIQPAPRPKKLVRKREQHSAETKKKMKESQIKAHASPNYKFPEHAKPMVKCNEQGEILEKYRSYSALCRVLGVQESNLRRMLRKGRPGYYKGFFYRYGE